MDPCSDNIYMRRIPEVINFPAEEEKVLLLWKELNVFYTCLKQSKGNARYSFYDGPPFATGLPHYGHILAGTIKDVITRYAHQQGYYVERRFGWDCHGLPVEYEIDKKLGIKGPDDVINMGITTYNNECRNIITRYANEWETIMVRLGRWIDFKNDYKTLYPWFMESVWWVFKQLYDKGLVYQGNKVMPYSTACSTPLSNFESGQNYKDVIDPAIIVTLPIIDDADGACLLIWTTTPWTLPSNLAACVHPTLQYVKIRKKNSCKVYVLMETRLEVIFPRDYEIIDKFSGCKLKGLKYKPIFPYFKELHDKGAFQVLVDEYVTSDCGTGVVHQAPYFGEDDFRVCLAAGLITKDQEPICPVDASGKFIKPVVDFEGQCVKDADKNIISMLRKTDRLLRASQVKHSYPFCWRSDTPLIYKAVTSWFIRVEHMREDLQKCISSTHWVPEFVKDKRFVNWLKGARDWAVSRKRYWGTPIPIWMSPDGNEICCVGSISELVRLSGTKVTDIHRESIDELQIPSKRPGNPPLRRICEVFDCWFESGSMPYAQRHYPFENCKEFKQTFPADFVAEGIDQTRGWFYTLLVISTALFGQAPFKNLVCNGLVLASDGQKMSKRKKNYPDPMEIISKYGADSLRLYLINSPVVRAENLRFKEEGVRDIIKDVFLPWYNAFRFLMQSITSYVHEKNVFVYSETHIRSDNIMDRWILSFTQSLLQYIQQEMAVYHLYNVVPRLVNYIDYLTNWYIRMNRKRFKGMGGTDDCKQCLLTLFNVIYNIIKIMSPFSPFLSETMYQYLKDLTIEKSESVHYLMLPQPNNDMINIDIERAVSHMQAIIEMGRIIRDRKTIPIKYPLQEIVVIHQSPDYINDIQSLQRYILFELNIKLLTTTTDKSKYNVVLRAEPDHKILGLRLKQDFKTVSSAIKSLTDKEVNEMIENGHKNIAGHRIELSEVRIIFKSITSSRYEVHRDNDVLVLLDCTRNTSMVDEGISREIINRVQKLRKKAHLQPVDKITVFYEADGEIQRVADLFVKYIEKTIQASFKKLHLRNDNDVVILEEHQTLKNCNLFITLTKRNSIDETMPVVKWANIQVLDIATRFCNGATKALILLEVDKKQITLEKLKKEISTLFGITSNFYIFTSKGKPVTGKLNDLSGHTVFVSSYSSIPMQNEYIEPFCKVRNFCEQGVSGTLILENPQGVSTNVEGNQEEIIRMWKTTFKT